MKISNEVAVIGGLALGVVVLGVLAAKTAAAGIKAAAPKIDPTSDQNLVYDNVIGGVGRAVSGDQSWSLGGWLYDVTHPAYDPNAAGDPKTGTWQSLTGG